MNRTTWRTLASAALLGWSLAGCDETPGSPQEVDLELDRLVRGVEELVAAVQAAGGLTPALRAQQARLDAEILGWQARTGRRDISVTEGVRAPDPGRIRINTLNTIEPGCTKAPATYNPTTREYCVLIACSPSTGTATYKCYTLPKTVS